jgi:4-hydroxy-3-polyprenylbenzoate decarboxylase
VNTLPAVCDLREWLHAVQAHDQLKTVEGADWNLEIGVISELNYRRKGHAALLFDRIAGYPPGFRVLTGSTGTPQRLGITFNMGPLESDAEAVAAFRGQPLRWESLAPQYDPVVVSTGPVLENSWRGRDVDLWKLPAPLWHEEDGGRYLGTGCACITRDPDTGWTNLGAYRGMVVDKDKMTVQIVPGKHGAIHLQKWFEREGRAPMAVSLGHHPLLTCLSGLEVPTNVSEYNYGGAILGAPIEVVKGPVTGLLIPAQAEIVLEGFLQPDRVASEGPYGEWTGYYSEGDATCVYVDVQAVHFRTDPTIVGSPPGRPPHDYSYMRTVLKSAMIFDALVKSGAAEIKGVWAPECAGGRLLVNVAIRQRYCGHAKQVGLLATSLQAAAYMNRYVIVVDDDVDVTSLEDVIWAVSTRTDPSQDISILDNMWGSVRDPVLRDHDRPYMSRAVIDACIPYEQQKSFPKVAVSRPELAMEIARRWKSVWE